MELVRPLHPFPLCHDARVDRPRHIPDPRPALSPRGGVAGAGRAPCPCNALLTVPCTVSRPRQGVFLARRTGSAQQHRATSQQRAGCEWTEFSPPTPLASPLASPLSSAASGWPLIWGGYTQLRALHAFLCGLRPLTRTASFAGVVIGGVQVRGAVQHVRGCHGGHTQREAQRPRAHFHEQVTTPPPPPESSSLHTCALLPWAPLPTHGKRCPWRSAVLGTKGDENACMQGSVAYRTCTRTTYAAPRHTMKPAHYKLLRCCYSEKRKYQRYSREKVCCWHAHPTRTAFGAKLCRSV